VLYGSDAVTGVVQIFTRTGSGPPTGDVAVVTGSRGTLDMRATLSGGDDAVAWSLSGGRFRTDGVYDLNNDYRNDVASGALRLRLAERTDARLAVRWSDNAYHFPTNGAGEVVDENAFQTGRRLTWSADLGHDLGARVETRLLLGGARLDGGTDDDPDSPGDTLGAYASWHSSDIVRRFVDLRMNVVVSEASLLTLGAELERQSESAEGESFTQFGTFPNAFEAERETRGYYAQLLAALGPARLTGGARLEDGETFGRQWTWRVGATSPLGRLVRVRFAAGTAFKEPTFFQTFATGFVRGNPDLRPEQSRSWEVGAELAADSAGDFVFGATWFDQKFTDLIDFASAPPEPDAPNYFNIASARARGLELTASLQPSPRTRVTAAYTNLRTIVLDTAFSGGPDAEFGEGLPLLRRPEHSGSLLLGWADADASGNITLLYVGERSDWDFSVFPFRRITLDAYTRLDASTAIPLGRVGEAPLTATLSVENLFDTDYEEVFNFRTPGRTVLVGGRLRL
ncbi:MAG: TonB-dependent receptor plug domain-containing protein, partial [Longimicrobiales bacterium]